MKWVFLATVVGLIVGLSTTAFLKILNWSSLFGERFPYYFLFLPLALFLSAAIIKYLAPDAEGHGTEKVIEAVHKHSGKIKAMVVPVKLVATVITLAAGGSVGKEGPCAQIGGGLSSMFADLFRFDDKDRKKLVICGISAGFASVFGTPIAGAIFGVEVLFIGNILYDVLLPSFISGIVSYHISSALGITYFYHPINFVPVFGEGFFLKVVLAGIFFGICSALLIECLKIGEKLSGRLPFSKPVKGIAGGVVIIGLVFLFSRQFLGLGLDTIESALQGTKIIWYAFLLKMIFTSVTLNFGGSGGIVTPIFFIGAVSGTLFSSFLGLDPGTFAAIGLVSLLAGAANTPIAASIMAVELFGPKVAPYATVACVISFLMTGHRSVYPSQVLAIRKSPSIQVEMGKEVEDVQARFKFRDKSLIGLIANLTKRIRRK
ncbi:MAG: chloride channel protein [Candidatus Omnitrophica bacterium]|nr:chloride channel protein [Candidatus Omnitrophota bacterium]